MTNYTILDVETGPLPESELAQFRPEFHADSRLKDPDKIRANILEKEQAWKEDLALSAVTGKVLCIGFWTQTGFRCFPFDEAVQEKQVLEDALAFIAEHVMAGGLVVGFCSRSFDIPFLCRRAVHYGLKVPPCFWQGRYLSDSFVDIAERWACGSRDPRDRISLDNLSKHLGTGAKNGDGANFASLWATDRQKALEYLKNDLVLTQKAYERLYL